MVSPTGKVVHNTPILKRGDEAPAVSAPCHVRTAKTWELIKAHSETGLTVQQIAEKMGISELTVAHAAKNHKFKIRDENGEVRGETLVSRLRAKERITGKVELEEKETSYQPPKPEPLPEPELKPQPLPKVASDSVNHPAHYMLPGGGETIDVIEDVCGEGVDEYYRGNIIKYICRYKEKGGAESLKKARWYLNRLISLQETKEEMEAEENGHSENTD
ncbi:DUF3310 domain-containing protein [Schwartzia succinivorans]|jgi:predicted DNA-binding protein (UPF0251 family)|uniref:Protein of unknwon function n=1 Tax=Schwartzia succinivorans DSM 10502 TaxID=1123243 RepID=A0A1M4V3H2_9FIRM|nr:DUF3310 domain-containing protein [Schwartzia succinivorans]SHE63452.1 Protein of unknwon function [Schwartzia succinivorans DSM 10502]